MKTACEEVVKYVLPAYRSIIAKDLVYSYGLTQEQAAKTMKISQAVISYYITAKRGKGIKRYEELKILKDRAHEDSKRLLSGVPIETVATGFCELCTLMRKNNMLKEEVIDTCTH
ncbi:MAG: transcriptional regulator [Nitrososphaeria archaeon]